MQSLQSLKGKVVLITGASAGIGEASAIDFASCGSKLILGGRRIERLEALKKDLVAKFGVEIHVAVLDVTSSDSVQKFVDSIPSDLKQIDILVNNAGLALGVDTAWEVSSADVDAMIDTNVKGVLNMLRAVVPGMVKRNVGHIINVGSIAGHEAYKGGSVYCASKFAVDAITKSLRKELVATNLKVSVVSPGLVQTEFSVVRFKGDEKKAEVPYNGLVPLSAHDISDNIIYIASRPEHVQIAEIIVFPSFQASTEVVHREAKK
eukprot:TRINITY_DN1514_c0_g2_i1.p1 TRINITY_DN1514_c0_g2~~TRINITY_DN1514_c0_g2_i1.p1  ORF type:complete len:263 (-),score=81.30 TRINITY_DN1514_c0_g2_i1:41-829(-)